MSSVPRIPDLGLSTEGHCWLGALVFLEQVPTQVMERVVEKLLLRKL